MSSALKVILLERVENLGAMGDVVSVKPGYARNYLLPQSKAMRATKDNIAFFEAKKAELEKRNEERKKEAAKLAKKLDGLTVVLIRHASESGHLYGSVNARDIAEIIAEQSKEEIGRSMVTLNQAFKSIGLFPVTVTLHPEVKVEVTVNVARSEDEAKIQAKTGKALVADDSENLAEVAQKTEEKAEAQKEELLEESALEAEKQKAEAVAEEAAEAEVAEEPEAAEEVEEK